jgi:CHAT domain-containing protein/tetratricopeptide (TPR) repeat protein
VFRLLHLLITGVVLAGVILTVPRRGAAPVTDGSVPVLLVASGEPAGEVAARRAVADAATAHGPSSAEYARAVDGLIVALSANGRGALDEALVLAEAAAARHRARVPFAADLASDAQVRLGQVLTERGAYARAAQVLSAAVFSAERTFGAEDRRTVEARVALGAAHFESRAYLRAADILARSVRILRRTGASPGDVALTRALECLAAIAQRQGAYAEARAYLNEVLAAGRTAPHHPSRITAFNLLALQLWFEGQMMQSKAISMQTLARAERQLQPEHPLTASTLRILSATQWGLGELADARTNAARALGIAQHSLGQRHPEVAALWNDLGNVNLELGRYIDAREQFVQALELAESTLGTQHEWIPTFLHNLALVDAMLGDVEAAMREQEQAIVLWERSLGHGHPFVATALAGLADVIRRQGAPREALPLLRRALAIRERALGPNHHETAVTVAALADALVANGEPLPAREKAEQALRIWEAGSSPDSSPAHATVLELYADMDMTASHFQAAHQRYQQALAIRTRALGSTHPLVADTMVRLAAAQAAIGQEDAAFDAALSAETIGREHLRLMLRYLPERESLNYASARPRGIDLILSLASAPGRERPALDALVRSRALVLDEMASRQVSTAEQDAAVPRRRLASAQQRLATLLLRGTGDADPERHVTLIDLARRANDDAERQLAHHSAAFRQTLRERDVGVREIHGAIPTDGALVSYVRFTQTLRGARGVPTYAAFVTRGAHPPVWVPLSSAEAIETLVQRWRDGLVADATAGTRSASRDVRAAGLALREAVWDPLLPHLSGATQMFVVPDGALNLLPLAALPGRAHEYLLEEAFAIHYLSSERDLIRHHLPTQSRRLLAVGGVTFAASDGTDARPAHCAAGDPMCFAPLPSTLEEVVEVARIWDGAMAHPDAEARLLLAAQADETTFKKLAPGYRVLHLATHGFAIEPSPSRALTPRALDRRTIRGGGRATVPVQSALRLTGLAMASANRHASVSDGQDDGLLTAMEVAALDLRGVDWAVLSACDTGVGHVQAGEGVIGLRRAFEVAGVRTVIMSLWPVEDRTTRHWMVALYQARFGRRLSTSESVRDASLSILASRRSKGESTSPFYWGAFVAAGRWN